MKTPNSPDDARKRFLGQQAGERGKGFAEITPAETKQAVKTSGLAIPKYKLQHGAYYRGRSRNATVARWNAHEEKFYYWREKFGKVFLETICHREDDSIFDVFDAIKEIPAPKKKIPFL